MVPHGGTTNKQLLAMVAVGTVIGLALAGAMMHILITGLFWGDLCLI